MNLSNPMQLPDGSVVPKLGHLIHTALLSKPGFVSGAPSKTPFWGAAHFNLDRVDFFGELSFERQQSVLSHCSRSLLEEAFCIEKAGMAYASKMSLLSETTEQRVLYNLFAGEEAVHFEMIRSFLGEGYAPFSDSDPFLQILIDLVQSGEYHSLVYIIQVLLEGWGIHHYRSLAQDCDNTELKTCLNTIIKDEAKHHGSGILILKHQPVPVQQDSYLNAILERFFTMVQVGPQRVVSILEQELGGLTREQRVRVFEQLDAQNQTTRNLNTLRSLMETVDSSRWISRLESRGFLNAYSATECAKLAS